MWRFNFGRATFGASLFVLLSSLVSAMPSAAAGPETIRAMLDAAIKDGTLPGAVVLVTYRGQPVFQEAFGWSDIERRRSHQVNDYFYLGSTSKPLAATAILTLADAGKWQLQQAASAWIPELGSLRLENGAAMPAPTLRQMLSHTSGMYGNATATRQQQLLVWNFRSTLAKTAGKIASQPLIYEPGMGFSYGGAAMTVAGRVTEIITGREFDDYVNQVLFEPLGMEHSFYRGNQNYQDQFAVLYQKDRSGKFRRARFQPRTQPGAFVLPPGGVISTAQDLAKFMQLHLSDCVQDGQRILSQALCLEMRTDQTNGIPMDFELSQRGENTAGLGGHEGYGLGWMLDEVDTNGVARVFYHGGAFGTVIWADSKAELSIVLLTHTALQTAAPVWDQVIAAAREHWADRIEPNNKTIARTAGAGKATDTGMIADNRNAPDRVVTLNPPDQSYVDPEFLSSDDIAVFQTRDQIWLARLDPSSGRFVSRDGKDIKLDSGVAALRETFNGPEFGVDKSGWWVFYTKSARGELQIWRTRLEGNRSNPQPLTSGKRHQSALVSRNPAADSVRLLMLQGTLDKGTILWIDADQPNKEIPVGAWEKLVNSPRWIDDEEGFVFSHREGVERGQLAMFDFAAGDITTLTNDEGDKTYPFAWKAPEFDGEILLLALIDAKAVGIYRASGGKFWERIATLKPPPEARHRYIGSPEPFTAGGRSYVSLVIKSEDVRSRTFSDAEVWIFGIEETPESRITLRCDDGEYPLMRFDPETYVGSEEVFIYYNARRGRRLDVDRCRTGIRP